MTVFRLVLAWRYRLLWAEARTRNGRVALLFLVYLLTVVASLVLPFVGFGAAAATAAGPNARAAATALIAGWSVFAIGAALVTGFRLEAPFAELSLRRYPVSRVQRIAARHVSGVLEPLWICLFVVAVGIADGFAFFTGRPMAAAATGAVLLTAATYLIARTLVVAGSRLAAARRGHWVLIAGMAVMVVATAGGPLLSVQADTAAAGRWLFGLTPAFLTAALVAGASSVDSWMPIIGLAAWVCGAGATLGALERLPRVSRAKPGAAAMWDDMYDRVTAAFGSPAGPLLGKTLRSYFRSAHLRLNYAFVVPLLTVMWWMQSGQSPDDRFAVALASMSLVGFASMGGMPLNVFGFDRTGFRRYFLLPVAPAVVVRVVGLVPMLLGAFQVIAALGAWMLLGSEGGGPRALAMLASTGIGGLALMSTGALWASVLAPRPIDPDVVFGNKLSPPANAVLIGMFVVFAGILFAVRGRGVADLVRVWWIVPLGAAGACALLGVSLAVVPYVFVARRERALGLIEGRG